MTIENRKARHEYDILETLEVGISLRGNEVKSIKNGRASIKEAYIKVQEGELILHQMHVTPWESANAFDVDELRSRKLLAHKKEIRKLGNQVSLNGYTLIPLRVYEVKGKIKLMLGLCKGRKVHDKRQAQKARDVQRDIARAYK